MSCFLGIDAGTSGVKAVVMDASGALLGKGYGECDLITPRPSWVEQDPQAWWEACDVAVRQAVAKSGRGGEVAGIGFSGQMQGLTLMDKEMKPIGNCMIWLDQRASAEAEELNRRIDPAEALEITANHCLPSYWAAKLLWLRKNRPEDYERINVALFPKDYLRYRMTGEIATDVSDASCSWLLDMKKSFAERCVPYLFIAGTFLMLIVFMYFSVGLAFYTSLTDKMPGRETHFIGLENYKALLSDDMFRMSFRNQAVLSLFAVFNSVFFPLLAALILYHVRHKKLSRIIKTLFVIPMLVPSIVVILIWKYLYNPNFGFNSILKLLHLGSLTQNWLNNADTALMCIILVGFPFVSGMYFLLFHTGINSISPELYDAARVDGATSMDVVRYVQIPGVWPYVKIVATLSLIGSLSGFGQVAAMTAGGPGYSTMIPALQMYKVAFGDGRHGYASALGVVLFFVIVILTLITNKVLSGKGEKSA